MAQLIRGHMRFNEEDYENTQTLLNLSRYEKKIIQSELCRACPLDKIASLLREECTQLDYQVYAFQPSAGKQHKLEIKKTLKEALFQLTVLANKLGYTMADLRE
jgi:hypothetical protein